MNKDLIQKLQYTQAGQEDCGRAGPVRLADRRQPGPETGEGRQGAGNRRGKPRGTDQAGDGIPRQALADLEGVAD